MGDVGAAQQAAATRSGVSPLILALVVSLIVVGGFIREHHRHPPLPPQAQHVAETLMLGTARVTTYWVPIPVEDVRRFYHRALSQQGWRYCGTQATPGCTTMPLLPAAVHQIDVYRRSTDRDATGPTIEIWPMWEARQRYTFVKVYETSPLRCDLHGCGSLSGPF